LKECGKRDEGVPLDALVRVADVFGHEGEQDGAPHGRPGTRYGSCAGKQVEEVEERALAAVRDGDVFGVDGPAVFASEKLHDGVDEAYPALRGVVAAHRVLEGVAARKEAFHFASPYGFDGGNACGVSSAEHAGCYPGRKGATEIVHELQYARIA